MLKLDKLVRYYHKGRQNEVRAVDGVSVELNTGLVMLVGKSGCGKTTLLNVIGGLDAPTSGSVTIGDTVFHRYQKRKWDLLRNRKIGYIFQNYNLVNSLTVFQNLQLALRLAGVPEDEHKSRVETALSLVGMKGYAGRRPNTLSGGQQQRVGIARAIVKGAKIIIADEPTGNLDDTNTIAVMEILKAISKHALVVMVTHEEELAEFYADRILRIVDGKVVSDEEASSTGSLVHHAQDHIYLGDMNCTTWDGGLPIRLFSDESIPSASLDVVVQKGRILLRVNGSCPTAVVDKHSSIQLFEGKYVPREASDHPILMDSELLVEGTLKPHRVFRIRDALKRTDYQPLKKKKANPFAALAWMTFFFTFLCAIVGANCVYDRDTQDLYHSNLIITNAPLSSAGYAESDVVKLVNMDPHADLKLSHAYLQWVEIEKFSYLPASCIGRELSSSEIIIDKRVIERNKQLFNNYGISTRSEDLKGIHLTVGANDVWVADIVNDRQPVVYIADSLYAELTISGNPNKVWQTEEWRNSNVVYVNSPDKVMAALLQLGYRADDVNGAIADDYLRGNLESSIPFLAAAGVFLVILLFVLLRVNRSGFISNQVAYAQYRSLGVTVRELYRHIMTKQLTYCAGYATIGWAVAFIITRLLATAVKALFASAAWIPFAALGMVYLISIIVTLLVPAATMRKTPAELLSKYDI